MQDMPNTDVTERLYCFIRHYTRTKKLPPTQREMADACFISAGTVNRHLDRLQMLGYIQRIEGKKRGIVLTEKTPLECGGMTFE